MFSSEMLERIRLAELEVVIPYLNGRILELGAGTGFQARVLSRRGFEIVAIDLPSPRDRVQRVFPITDYDGIHTPFSEASFDSIFSSNVLEHVRHLSVLHTEIKRVLKPGGVCVHVLPTHVWRFWTSVSAFPNALIHVGKALGQHIPPFSSNREPNQALWDLALRQLGAALIPLPHGEYGTAFSELWRFRPEWWRVHFRANGFEILADRPIGLFYTGNLLLGQLCSIEKRQTLARRLGSAAHLFAIKPRSRIDSP